jgi:prophage maintenance system killer protein
MYRICFGWFTVPCLACRSYIPDVQAAGSPPDRLARNHPLPDGNKRTAFFLTGLFLEANGAPLCSVQPDVDVQMVERIAAGQVERREILAWLSERTA